MRLGRQCGGFRDVSDLMFKNETSSVFQKHSAADNPSELEELLPATTQPVRNTEAEVLSFFFDQFVTQAHLSFLDGISPDEFLLKPILACGLSAIANRHNDDKGRGLARQYYIEAITATSAALQHPQQVLEDNTLISVCLLSIFERLSWDSSVPSSSSWRHHIEGASKVLDLRGKSQLSTALGASLFRELRESIVFNAIMNEVEVSEHIVQWNQSLVYEPSHAPADQLSALASRLALLRADFHAGTKPDDEMAKLALTLDQEFVAWSERTPATGLATSSDALHKSGWLSVRRGTRHEYNRTQAQRQWNTLRSLRIILSRLREAIWRRSGSATVLSTQLGSVLEDANSIKASMASDICEHAAYTLSADPSEPSPKGAVSNGYLMIMPLFIAGTCLLEETIEPIASSNGSRIILINEPWHQNLFDQQSTQLSWIIEQLDYIANGVGIRYAGQMSRFLKGESAMYYDVDRSRVLRSDELPPGFHYDSADFAGLLDFSGVEG